MSFLPSTSPVDETFVEDCARNDCQRCADLEQMLRDSQDSERQLVDLVDALNRKLGQSARSELALERKLKETREDDPLSQDIKRVLLDWRQKTKHPRANISLTGVRAEKVRARLKHGFTVDDCLKANTGAGRYPYVVNAQRRATGEKEQRFDDAELIFRNEKTVEKFIELADRVDEPKPSKVVPLMPEPRLRHEGIDDVLAALTARGCAWRPAGREHWMAQCCVHEDRTPSLSITVKNGKVLVECRGCGARAPQVREVLDLPWAVFMEADGA